MFATFLANLLTVGGVQQSELARRLCAAGCKVSESAVSLWCSGGSLPTRDKIPIIAKVLNLNSEQAAGLKHAFFADPGPARSDGSPVASA